MLRSYFRYIVLVFLRKSELKALERAAFHSTNIGDYERARQIWSYLADLTNYNLRYLILSLENARLSGYLPYVIGHISAKFTIADIENALGVGNGFYLMEHLISNRLLTDDSILSLKKSIKSLPKNLIAVISESLSRKELLNVGIHSSQFDSIRHSNSVDEIFRFDEPYDIKLQPLAVEYPKDFPQYQVSCSYLSFSLFAISNVKLVIGSDLMKVNDEVLLDHFSFFDSQYSNLASDPLLIRLNPLTKSVDYFNSDFSEISLNTAFWLGYPASTEWGHWFNEFLTRLALLFEYNYNFAKQISIIIPASTPDNFTKFAEAIWGSLHWIKFVVGDQVFVKRLYIVPSRNHISLNPFFNLKMLSSRVNADHVQLSLLKKHILCVSDTDTSSSFFKSGIFIDRNLAKYRKSLNSDQLREWAKRKGMFVIDPGTLSATEQMALFRNNRFFAGLAGSGWFLATLADSGSGGIVIGNDLVTDWSGLFNVFQKEWGQSPSIFVGIRKYPYFGYSEELYHQDFFLPKNSLKILDDLYTDKF